ncbi:hypothetical protein Taro_019660, partial [Colocasia esculenta]|nr:hypothetical protein [Colocasia esculenta]
MKVPMGPPPSKIPSPPPEPNPSSDGESSAVATPSPDGAEVSAQGRPEEDLTGAQVSEASEGKEPPEKPASSQSSAQPVPRSRGVAVPYEIPPWSEAPGHPFYFEVLKDGAIIEQLHVSEKGAYMFGRIDLCDFVLEHPTISRFHAVLQFRKNGEAFLYDLGSTHGTFLNKNQENGPGLVMLQNGARMADPVLDLASLEMDGPAKIADPDGLKPTGGLAQLPWGILSLVRWAQSSQSAVDWVETRLGQGCSGATLDGGAQRAGGWVAVMGGVMAVVLCWQGSVAVTQSTGWAGLSLTGRSHNRERGKEARDVEDGVEGCLAKLLALADLPVAGRCQKQHCGGGGTMVALVAVVINAETDSISDI